MDPLTFVGRKAELARLDSSIREMEANHGGLFFVSGHAGTGKSSFVMEVAKRYEHSSLEIAFGGSDESRSAGISLLPWRDLLEENPD